MPTVVPAEERGPDVLFPMLKKPWVPPPARTRFEYDPAPQADTPAIVEEKPK